MTMKPKARKIGRKSEINQFFSNKNNIIFIPLDAQYNSTQTLLEKIVSISIFCYRTSRQVAME